LIVSRWIDLAFPLTLRHVTGVAVLKFLNLRKAIRGQREQRRIFCQIVQSRQKVIDEKHLQYETARFTFRSKCDLTLQQIINLMSVWVQFFNAYFQSILLTEVKEKPKTFFAIRCSCVTPISRNILFV